MSSSILSACVAAAVLMTMAPARAESVRVCTDYARTALAAHSENLRMSCGYSGGRWFRGDLEHRDGFGHHFNWCRGQTQGAIALEARARKTGLDKCKSCIVYADTAVRQHSEQIPLCDLRGDRFSTDHQGHLRWCIANFDNPTMGPKTETRARTRMTTDCVNAHASCDSYARTAQHQQAENLRRDCGPRVGPAWSYNFDDHRNWCAGVAPGERRNQTQIRADSLRQFCKHR